MRIACISLCLITSLLHSTHTVYAQIPTAVTAFDATSTTIPSPVSTGVLGRHDEVAVSEIASHLLAVGGGPWTGMQGAGQITYGSTDSTQYPATLTILGSRGFRLDGQTSKGSLSIRIFGKAGQIQEADGSKSLLFPKTASTGIFQFGLLRTAKLDDAQLSLIDGGTTKLRGSDLHRITIEFAATAARPTQSKVDTVATDYYFDPATHLLVKSVNAIRLNGTSNVDFLRVITYGDYRKIGGSTVPFRYEQTLDGQLQWTLQLTEVQLGPTVDAKYFQF